jgi:hypothetical protein
VSDLEDEIRDKTEAFAERLAALLRRAVLEGAVSALSVGREAAAVAVAPTPGSGRLRRGTASASAATTTPPLAKVGPVPRGTTYGKAAPKRAPGEKRSHAELAKLTEKLGEYIKVNPGKRMEAISEALGASPAELRFPVVKLVRAKKVRAEGRKQNTAYFPV